MVDGPATLYARLKKLAELVELARLSQSEKDRARMERTIQLVSQALRTVAWAHHRIGAAEQQRQRSEIAVLLSKKMGRGDR
jgi:hypothetical protein